MDEQGRSVEIVVRGRVQGVGFRYSTVDEARAIGVRGWVRNEPDGSVRIAAAGTPDQIEALKRWCGHGPARARVDDVEVVPRDGGSDLPLPFDVRR